VAAWSRIIRAILLSLDDVGNALKAIYQSKTKKKVAELSNESNTENYQSKVPIDDSRLGSSWIAKWKVVDYIGVILFVLFLLLIVLAPLVIGVSLPEIYEITLKEFHPWP